MTLEQLSKFTVLKVKDDPANRLTVGQVIEVYSRDLDTDIVNIGGAHYLAEELDQYFKEVK
jgi:hypothetical protein